MLGFKLDAPRRGGTLKDKAQPIYLDMQVWHILTSLHLFLTRAPLGDDACRSPGARCDAPLHDGPVWKPA